MIDVCLLNARSIIKALIIEDFVIDNNIDNLAFPETCISPGPTDQTVINSIYLNGNLFQHVSHKKRGGVVVLYKQTLKLKTTLIKFIERISHSKWG